MALYCSEYKVALAIIDDPREQPADVSDGLDAFEIAVAQTKDLHEALMSELPDGYP